MNKMAVLNVFIAGIYYGLGLVASPLFLFGALLAAAAAIILCLADLAERETKN